MLQQYVDNKFGKRVNSGGGHMSLNGEPITLKLVNTQSSDKNKGDGDSGDTSNVAYTIFQTEVLGTSPLKKLCNAFVKKGGYLVGNTTSLCFHGLCLFTGWSGRG